MILAHLVRYVMKYNLIKRIGYYNSKLYVEQLESGMDYKTLPNVISLVFVYHDVFSGKYYSDSYVNNIYLWHKESDTILEDNNHIKIKYGCKDD